MNEFKRFLGIGKKDSPLRESQGGNPTLTFSPEAQAGLLRDNAYVADFEGKSVVDLLVDKHRILVGGQLIPPVRAVFQIEFPELVEVHSRRSQVAVLRTQDMYFNFSHHEDYKGQVAAIEQFDRKLGALGIVDVTAVMPNIAEIMELYFKYYKETGKLAADWKYASASGGIYVD